MKNNLKRVSMAILISDKIKFKTNVLKKLWEHYNVVKVYNFIMCLKQMNVP